MNDALKAAANVDPEWAKKEQRRQWLVKATVAGTLIALAVGAVAFVLGVHNSTEITHVEKTVEKTVENSACQEHPAGTECQRAKVRSSKAADLYVTCISFHKAGYPCPKPGSAVAERLAASAPAAHDEGGGATSSPSTGHSLPGRHEGGSSATDHPSHPHAPSVPHQSGGGGGSEAAPAPGTPTAPAPTASSSPGTSSSSTTEPPAEAPVVEGTPSPEAPVRQGAGVLLESVGGVVEETGSTVNEVVGGVTGTTCELAKVLC